MRVDPPADVRSWDIVVAAAPKPNRLTRRKPARFAHPGAPRLWRALLTVDRLLVALTGRLEITGSLPTRDTDRPLLLVPNHIGNVDPLVVLAACHQRGLAPRMLATGGLFDAPILGTVLLRCGHVRADRGASNVTEALGKVVAALRSGGQPIIVYPEGRITLEPGMWPERGKTGAARMALASGATVVPVSQWGAHEILPYTVPPISNAREMGSVLRSWLGGIRRRPRLRVHFGAPVDLSGLRSEVPGDSVRARERIMRAITTGLEPLRATEPDAPQHHDPTWPGNGKPCPWRG